MQNFTLKELVELFNKYNEYNEYNSDKCEGYKNAWILSNRNNYHFEKLNEEDIIDLRPYLKCWILSIYEYLAIQDNAETDSWFNKYKNEKCRKQENDFYISMQKLYFLIHGDDANVKGLEESFQIMLDKSIEPFRSRGIPRTCIDDSV